MAAGHGSTESTARAILYAFVANFGIAITKSGAAWLTGSGSMLAAKIRLSEGVDVPTAIENINALERKLKE